LSSFSIEYFLIMIQVDQALSIITANSCKMATRKIKVKKSLGYILAEAIYSPLDMPPFRQSSMDGYAFSHSERNIFKVVSTSQAGDFSNKQVKEDQAVRIFTGAHIPDNLDTVVMQEHTSVNNETLEISIMPERFANVRSKGEQIKKSELVLNGNTVITPAAIGFLACLGISEILVYEKPTVAIIVTGNELVKVGEKLSEGKIYESNSIMLEAALLGIGIKKMKTFHVKDNLKATKKVLKSCLSDFDVFLVSGGISVGDYDFVKEALLSNGVEELFHSINQKPGKPLFFGKKDKSIVFGLPGNPASTLTSFYIYVYPALKISMGFNVTHLPKIKRKIATRFENTSGKALFLKAFFDNETVTVLEGQSSAMLKTYAIANALIYVPFDKISIDKDEEVMVLPLN
jgi:molybdopterin molybdotransferase